MYIESVPNRNSPPAILLRESYRDGGKIKKHTIANLSDWPTEIVEGLRTLLKGGKVAPADHDSIIVRRALPHGHVAAVLGTLRDIGLDRVLGPPRNRCCDLVIAMIVARLIAPASKLATARMLDPLTAASSLGDVLGLGPVDEDELYVALDWLGERQEAMKKALARKHLHDGTLVLYDVSSSCLEGRCCELARRGHNRDGKKGKLQIVYGLLCAPDGCPVAIEVFEGDTGDPRTLAAQIDKVKKRFALDRVALVGDRGMITQARLDAEVAPAGLDWITALRAPAIRALVEAGTLQMSLFDQRDMAAITSPDYPGERRHSSAPRQQPEQLLVNTLKLRLYRAASQPIVVAAQQKMDRDDNAVHYLLGWSLFGFYYGFLVLIPITLVAAVAGSAVHGEAISSILLTILAILAQAIGLQGGYMIGLTGRDVLSQLVARHAEPGTSSFPGDCGAIFAWKLTRKTYFLAFVRDRADLATACARG